MHCMFSMPCLRQWHWHWHAGAVGSRSLAQLGLAQQVSLLAMVLIVADWQRDLISTGTGTGGLGACDVFIGSTAASGSRCSPVPVPPRLKPLGHRRAPGSSLKPWLQLVEQPLASARCRSHRDSGHDSDGRKIATSTRTGNSWDWDSVWEDGDHVTMSPSVTGPGVATGVRDSE